MCDLSRSARSASRRHARASAVRVPAVTVQVAPVVRVVPALVVRVVRVVPALVVRVVPLVLAAPPGLAPPLRRKRPVKRHCDAEDKEDSALLDCV